MRFRSLRAFRLVIEEGTIAGAALKLNLSQPAVSRLISGLEAELGVVLFLRQGRGLMPTAEGLRLFDEMQGILVAVDRLPLVARQIKEGVQQRIRIVSMPRLAFSIALPVMGMIHAEDPGIRCDLVVFDRVDLEKWILDHEFDIGLAVLPIETPAVDVTRLGTSPIDVVVCKKHPKARHKTVEFADLIGEPVVALPDGTRDRTYMEAMFRTHSAKPKIHSVVPTVAAAANLAAAGVGITFADRLSISELQHLPIKTLRVNPTWSMEFGLFRPAHRRLTPAVRSVVAAVERKYREINLPYRKAL